MTATLVTLGQCVMALQQPHRVQIATTVETMAAENWSYFDFPGELSEHVLCRSDFMFQYFWGQVKENLARNVGQDQS